LSHHQHMGGDARALKITSWLTGIYFLVELGIGIWTGSVAVLSDSFHTFSAVGGIVLAIVASRIAARSADKSSSFGMKRAEIIGPASRLLQIPIYSLGVEPVFEAFGNVLQLNHFLFDGCGVAPFHQVGSQVRGDDRIHANANDHH